MGDLSVRGPKVIPVSLKVEVCEIFLGDSRNELTAVGQFAVTQ